MVTSTALFEEMLDSLTGSTLKRRVFAEDLYFRESWNDSLSVIEGDVAEILQRAALLMLKPDAVASRRIEAILDFAAAHDFEPVWASPVRLDRHSIRELWRYDWHVYPVDRLRFCDFWYPAAPVLVFALRDTTPHLTRSASERLSELKGSSLPGDRPAGSLRSVLRSPNQVLNFVHVADEPMDLIREAGILLDRPERLNFLASFGSSKPPETHEIRGAITSIYAETPPHDLEFEGGIGRLVHHGALSRTDAARLRTAVLSRNAIGWDEIRRMIEMPADQLLIWDIIAVASALIPLERTEPPAFSWTDSKQTAYSGQSSLPPGGIVLAPPGRS